MGAPIRWKDDRSTEDTAVTVPAHIRPASRLVAEAAAASPRFALTGSASPGDPRPTSKGPSLGVEGRRPSLRAAALRSGSARGRRGGQSSGDGAGRGPGAPGGRAGLRAEGPGRQGEAGLRAEGAGRGRPGADTEGRGGLPRAPARPAGRTSGRRSESSGPAARRPRQGQHQGPGSTGSWPWAGRSRAEVRLGAAGEAGRRQVAPSASAKGEAGRATSGAVTGASAANPVAAGARQRPRVRPACQGPARGSRPLAEATRPPGSRTRVGAASPGTEWT